MSGKEIRLERIINRDTGKSVIIPMDHGVSVGPILGITNMREAMSQVAEGGASAVVVHKGVVGRGHRKSGPDMGLIVHLSASTSLDTSTPTLDLLNGEHHQMIREYARFTCWHGKRQISALRLTMTRRWGLREGIFSPAR